MLCPRSCRLPTFALFTAYLELFWKLARGANKPNPYFWPFSGLTLLLSPWAEIATAFYLVRLSLFLSHWVIVELAYTYNPKQAVFLKLLSSLNGFLQFHRACKTKLFHQDLGWGSCCLLSSWPPLQATLDFSCCLLSSELSAVYYFYYVIL